MPDINLSPLTAEQSALDRRRRMAEAMQQQAILPIDMPNVAGAKVSPYQGLAKLLQGYIAGKSLEKADIEQQKQQSDYLSDVGYILQNIGKNTEGSSEIPEKTETIRTPIAANQNLQELALRQTLMRDPNAAISPFEKKIDRSQLEVIAKLPLESFEEKVTPRVPAVLPRPILSTDLLMGNNAKGILSGGTAGKLALAQALMQQKTLEQAADLESKKLKSRNPEEEIYRFVNGNYEVVSAGKPKDEFFQPVTELDAQGKPITVAYDKRGNRKVIDTKGAYTPNQWTSMSVADKARILFDQYKFKNLSAEQIQQARQKDAQLDQEMAKIGFDTGMKVQGAVGVLGNAQMPNLVGALTSPASASAPAVAPVIAPAPQAVVTPVKKPYVSLDKVNQIPPAAPAALPAPPAPSDQAANQPPKGLSGKAQQQWIIENAKKQMESAAESAKSKPQEKLSAETALTNLTRMKNVAEELSGHKGLDSIIGRFNQYSFADMSDNAINARALQGTLVKQSATAALQAMRDASKTGGAVGGVSEKEWPILEQQIAALDSAQTPKAYRIALKNLQSQLDSSIKNITQAYESRHGKLDFIAPQYFKQDEAESGWKVVK
jgi:YD repeat-containing protein